MIFAIKIHYIKTGAIAVSGEGYKTLEGAIEFIKSRSDYKGQKITNWCVETKEHIYEIIAIQIAE